MMIWLWSWLLGLAHKRLAVAAARRGHAYWWRDAQTGRVTFDDDARSACLYSIGSMLATPVRR